MQRFAYLACGVLLCACRSGVPSDGSSNGGDGDPALVPGILECPAPDDDDDEMESDAGTGGAMALERHSDVESAIVDITGVCELADECGFDDEDDCLSRAFSEDLVRQAKVEGGLDCPAQDRCREAVEAVDSCSLALSCDDFEFFISNSVADYVRGVCFELDGEVVECPSEYPCFLEEAEFEAACVNLWNAIDAILLRGGR